MSAMYRMLEQSWSPEDALAELIDGGYGYHSMWKNIKRYVLSVGCARAARGDRFHGSTSTVTDNLCSAPPRITPRSGDTSPKSRPQATAM